MRPPRHGSKRPPQARNKGQGNRGGPPDTDAGGAADLSDAEVAQLQGALAELAERAEPGERGEPAGACEPLDASAIDGYLCGVLLQPRAVPSSRWWPPVLGGGPAAAPGAAGLPGSGLRGSGAPAIIRALVERRHAVLEAAIGKRRWFDPWLIEAGFAGGDPEAVGQSGPHDEDAAEAKVRATVLPWVAGFVQAQQEFPDGLEAIDDPELLPALALLYQYLDPADLEADEDALAAAVAELQPASTLAEAAEDIVRAVLLLADVSRPRR